MNITMQDNGLMDTSNDAQLAKTGLIDKSKNQKLRNLGQDLNVSNNNSVFDMSQQLGIIAPDSTQIQNQEPAD